MPKSARQLDSEIADILAGPRGPKKIGLPAADPSRHPSQYGSVQQQRRVAQYNTAKRDVEIEAYTAGQQAAKRAIVGPGGHLRPRAFDRDALLVAYDTAEEGRIEDAHNILGIRGALHSWDNQSAFQSSDEAFSPQETKAFRSGYIDGFTARLRKLAYPGQRVRGAREDK